MCGAGRDARVTTVFYLEVKLIIYLEVGCATLSSLDGSLPPHAAGSVVRTHNGEETI